jgi:hypothetical protein
MAPKHRLTPYYHEAAHAVIAALCPYLHGTAVGVVPVGQTEPRYSDDRDSSSNLLCYSDIGGYHPPVANSEHLEMTDTLARDLQEWLACLSMEEMAYWWQTWTARVCLALAGMVAEDILAIGLSNFDPADYQIEDDGSGDREDWKEVHWYCNYIRNPRGLSTFTTFTARALSEPAVWQLVHNMAKKLEEKGHLSRACLHSLLPPPRVNWPPLGVTVA